MAAIPRLCKNSNGSRIIKSSEKCLPFEITALMIR